MRPHGHFERLHFHRVASELWRMQVDEPLQVWDRLRPEMQDAAQRDVEREGVA